MKTKLLFALVFCMIALTGCYTTTTETGRMPSNITVNKNWATGWFYGLVPPSTVEVAARCPDGVAKVMTQISFLNRLAGVVTLGIYTPMTIQVTCARASETSLVDPKDAFVVSKDASSEAFQNVFMAAAEKAARSDSEVFVLIADKKQNQRSVK